MTESWLSRRARGALGGPGRLRVVLALAAVLALNSADFGTLGATAAQLESDLGISNAQLGLLAAASSGVGALGAVPMGVLADRVNRMRLLGATVAVWAVAMASGGLAPDYNWLLLSRLLLGVAVAASGPLVVSLTGDLFPPSDRAGVLGWVLTGELVGSGVGLLAGGTVATALSWRYAFFMLAVVSAVLAFALPRMVAEPQRGGASWLRSDRRSAEDPARAVIAARDVRPVPGRILRRGQATMRLPAAYGFLLHIPTNVLLIIGSAVGYFFFAGLRTFVVVFAMRHYGVAPTALLGLVLIVGVAAVAGAVLGGRLTDRALHRGRTTARVTTPAVGFAAAALLFLPALLTDVVALAIVPIALGAAALAAANPPLDAARLDIVPGVLWGRAESLRTLLRLCGEAIAPATFGALAEAFAGPGGGREGAGLRDAFLVMLVPLLVNGLVLLRARLTYATDVATALAAEPASGPRE